ncbi:MAG: hypothetical protein JWN48_863 [Myxococcaceae bacterium]|nr:hypothetical protein [Myxococcaceae bacterium]
MSSEYRALVAKVAAFTDATTRRREADLTCSAGCSSCCHAWLSVTLVEADALREGLSALPPDERARVRARGVTEQERERAGESQPRCALLGEDERCSVYEHRPLVCRTQGHALRYPTGFIPAAAIARKTMNGEETWCPLNYHAAEPLPADVLDAERVDQILAVVATRYFVARSTTVQRKEKHGPSDPSSHARTPARLDRFPLSALAAEEEVFNDPTARAAHLEVTNR